MNPLARVSSDSISLSMKDYHLSHWFVVVVFNRSIFFFKFLFICVNYKLTLVVGTCHLPLSEVNPVLLQLLTLNIL